MCSPNPAHPSCHQFCSASLSQTLYSVSSMSSVTLRWPALWSRYLLGISPGMLYRSPRPGLKHSDLAIHSLITH